MPLSLAHRRQQNKINNSNSGSIISISTSCVKGNSMPDLILLQEERQTAKWRQHCVRLSVEGRGRDRERGRLSEGGRARRQLVATALQRSGKHNIHNNDDDNDDDDDDDDVRQLPGWLPANNLVCCLFAFHSTAPGKARRGAMRRMRIVPCWACHRGCQISCVCYNNSNTNSNRFQRCCSVAHVGNYLAFCSISF